MCIYQEFDDYIAIARVLEGGMLVTCVCVLIGAKELGLCPWLSYQAFEGVKIAVTRASLSGSGS